MIKFYKTIKDYAEQNWMCRQTASKLYKEWKLELLKVEPWSKYIWITIK